MKGGRGGGECEQRSEAFVKIQKKNCFLVGREKGGSGWGGQGGCERRSKVFVKIQKKIFFFFFLGGGGGVGRGGQIRGGVGEGGSKVWGR